MSTTAAELSNPMPTAKQAMEMLALAEAENASEALRQKKKADAEKKALIDKLSKPSGISEQEARIAPLRGIGLKADAENNHAIDQRRAQR
jgi:hypothetical protein